MIHSVIVDVFMMNTYLTVDLSGGRGTNNHVSLECKLVITCLHSGCDRGSMLVWRMLTESKGGIKIEYDVDKEA